MFTSKKIAGEVSIEVTEAKTPRLSLINNALPTSLTVICVMETMKATHADTFFSAFMNINILLLGNTYGTFTIRRLMIGANNLPF